MRPKAISVLTTLEGLGNDMSLADDTKESLDRTTSFVGDENFTYRNTISRPRVAHAIGHDLHALSPMAVAVLKQSNEGCDEDATRIPLEVNEAHASFPEAQYAPEPGQMAHMRSDMAKMRVNTPHSLPSTTTHPNEAEWRLLTVETSDACPHTKVKLSRHTTDASPPVQREVSPSTTRQPQQRKVVSEDKEMGTSKCSPITKVAPVLPIHLLALSMRTIPSHPQGDEAQTPSMEVPKQIPAIPIQAKPSCPSNDEFKSTSLVVYGREDLEDVISLRKETNIDAYQTVASDVPVSINPCPAMTNLLSQGDALCSQPPNEAATTTQ
jgi:hypothetical protein